MQENHNTFLTFEIRHCYSEHLYCVESRKKLFLEPYTTNKLGVPPKCTRIIEHNLILNRVIKHSYFGNEPLQAINSIFPCCFGQLNFIKDLLWDFTRLVYPYFPK